MKDIRGHRRHDKFHYVNSVEVCVILVHHIINLGDCIRRYQWSLDLL